MVYEVTLTKKVMQWGDSLGIIIDKVVLNELKIKKGDLIEVTISPKNKYCSFCNVKLNEKNYAIKCFNIISCRKDSCSSKALIKIDEIRKKKEEEAKKSQIEWVKSEDYKKHHKKVQKIR